MARLLQPSEQHYLDKAADVETRRSRIEADVGAHSFLFRQRIERRGVRHLMDVAALVEETKE
jgi:hypothetical protein